MCSSDLKDSIVVDIYDYDRGTNNVGTEISISVGKIEYVADARAPKMLKCVRIWKGSDSLLYDLYPTGADYSMSYGNEPEDGKKLSQADAAKLWASYVEKFESLQKTVQVSVRRS